MKQLRKPLPIADVSFIRKILFKGKPGVKKSKHLR